MSEVERGKAEAEKKLQLAQMPKKVVSEIVKGSDQQSIRSGDAVAPQNVFGKHRAPIFPYQMPNKPDTRVHGTQWTNPAKPLSQKPLKKKEA